MKYKSFGQIYGIERCVRLRKTGTSSIHITISLASTCENFRKYFIFCLKCRKYSHCPTQKKKALMAFHLNGQKMLSEVYFGNRNS